MLLADDRREQGHFGRELSLPNTGPVAVHQVWKQYLKQAADELVVEHRPQLVGFEEGVHSRKRTRHGFVLPVDYRVIITLAYGESRQHTAAPSAGQPEISSNSLRRGSSVPLTVYRPGPGWRVDRSVPKKPVENQAGSVNPEAAHPRFSGSPGVWSSTPPTAGCRRARGAGMGRSAWRPWRRPRRRRPAGP